MLNIPEVDELITLAAEVAVRHGGDGPIVVDEYRLHVLAEQIRSIAHSNQGITVEDSLGNILTTIVLSIVRDPPVDEAIRFWFAERVARDCAQRNGFNLDPAFIPSAVMAASQRLTADNLVINAVRDVYHRAVVDVRSGLPPEGLRYSSWYPFAEPLRAFVGLPMSALPFDRLRELERTCERIREVLEGLGFVCYLPTLHSSPIHHTDRAYTPATYVDDVDELVRTDFVIGLHEQPSTGLGIALSLGARSGAAELVFGLHPELGSPLAIGTTHDVQFEPIVDDEHIVATVTEFVTDRWVELEARRRRRVDRPRRLGPLLDAVRAGFADPPAENLTGHPPVLMTRRRALELCRSVDHFATATQEELDDLLSVTGARPITASSGAEPPRAAGPHTGAVRTDRIAGDGAETLPMADAAGRRGFVKYSEMRALSRARIVHDWTDADCDELIDRALSLRSAARRLELGDPADWKRLHDTQRGR